MNFSWGKALEVLHDSGTNRDGAGVQPEQSAPSPDPGEQQQPQPAPDSDQHFYFTFGTDVHNGNKRFIVHNGKAKTWFHFKRWWFRFQTKHGVQKQSVAAKGEAESAGASEVWIWRNLPQTRAWPKIPREPAGNNEQRALSWCRCEEEAVRWTFPSLAQLWVFIYLEYSRMLYPALQDSAVHTVPTLQLFQLCSSCTGLTPGQLSLPWAPCANTQHCSTQGRGWGWLPAPRGNPLSPLSQNRSSQQEMLAPIYVVYLRALFQLLLLGLLSGFNLQSLSGGSQVSFWKQKRKSSRLTALP